MPIVKYDNATAKKLIKSLTKSDLIWINHSKIYRYDDPEFGPVTAKLTDTDRTQREIDHRLYISNHRCSACVSIMLAYNRKYGLLIQPYYDLRDLSSYNLPPSFELFDKLYSCLLCFHTAGFVHRRIQLSNILNNSQGEVIINSLHHGEILDQTSRSNFTYTLNAFTTDIEQLGLAFRALITQSPTTPRQKDYTIDWDIINNLTDPDLRDTYLMISFFPFIMVLASAVKFIRNNNVTLFTRLALHVDLETLNISNKGPIAPLLVNDNLLGLLDYFRYACWRLLDDFDRTLPVYDNLLNLGVFGSTDFSLLVQQVNSGLFLH